MKKSALRIIIFLSAGFFIITSHASAFDIVFLSQKTPYATVHLKNGKTVKVNRNRSGKGTTTYRKKSGKKMTVPTRFTRLSYKASSISKICCGVRCKKPKSSDKNWFCR